MLIFERTTCHLPYLGLQAAASAAASALYIYYVVIGGRFAPPYKYMVKYIKQKQQQEQQFQSLLPPELDTLTLHEGGLPNIKGGLPLFRPLEYEGCAPKVTGGAHHESTSSFPSGRIPV